MRAGAGAWGVGQPVNGLEHGVAHFDLNDKLAGIGQADTTPNQRLRRGGCGFIAKSPIFGGAFRAKKVGSRLAVDRNCQISGHFLGVNFDAEVKGDTGEKGGAING